jgi:hypothetical protein
MTGYACNIQLPVEEEVEVKLRQTISLGVGLPSEADDQIFVFCLTIAC